jgi:hypothetical protein
MSAETRWADLDGSHAWTDIMNQWVNVDQPSGKTNFVGSVVNTIHGPELAACEDIGPNSNCQQTDQCWAYPASSDGAPATGAVSSDIWNSFVIIHEVCVIISSIS